MVESPEKITAIPAEGASGAIEVVTNAGTASYAGFSWFPKPVITSFSPAKAGTGDILTITGTNLNGATSVKFGSIAAGGYNATSPNLISVLVPYGESGDITVTTPGGTTSITGFTHIPAPSITGYTKSGQGEYKTVSISGTNFLGANSVTFGGVAANSFTVQSENEIIAIVGPNAIGTISVTTPGGTGRKKGFMFQEPPYIHTFLPESGPVGTSMTITGSNFNLTASGNKVYFGTISATVISAAENELVVIVPAGIANEPIRVLNLSTKLNGFSERRFSLTYSQTNPVPANLFSSNTELLLQDQPVGNVGMVDFDGDGRNDLIVPIASYENFSSIAIFRNDVKQGIAPASFAEMLRVGSRNYDVGDVNGDGSTDLVYSSGKHIILLKNVSVAGSISFEPDTLGIDLNHYLSHEVSIKDVDLDGKNDIVTATGFFRNISTFLPGRPMTFIKGVAPILENVSEPSVADIARLARSEFQHYTVFVADIDGDQRPEIIHQDLSSTGVAIFRNEHTSGKLSLASFSRPFNFYFEGAWGTIQTFADLDGDAKIDMISVDQWGVRVHTNVSSPGIFKWEGKNLYNTGTFPGSVSLSAPSIGDLDGDGKPELVTINATNYKIIILHSHPALAPEISNFSPAAAPAGATVTVTGKNLLSTTSVSFGGQPAASLRVISSTSLTAVVGGGASGDVSLINHADTALKSGFSFIPQPEIISFSPAVAASGTTVTITGKNFKDVTAISFGGTPASSFAVVSDDRITAVAGGGNTGDVSVFSNAEPASKPGFTFIPSPAINSFSPAAAASGTTVTISGENFTGVSAVNFGGTPAASFTVVSPIRITAVLGDGASGDLSVVTEGGTAVKSAFMFIPAPVISSFSPAAAVEGTLITITGENFTETNAVSFGGTPAASFTVLSPTTITAVVGKGASGEISIKAAGGSASKSSITILPLPVITADGQTTFVTGGSVVLNAAPSSGYTYTWARDGMIIPGATSASVTVTQSGSYTATIELNSVKSSSNAIDVKVVYVLPASNFKVQVTGESCKAGENGTVKITAEQGADYTVTIKGNNKDAAYKFSTSYEIQNLTAGAYQLCITVAGQPDFSRCFEVIVTEPKDLSLISSVDIGRKMLALRMEGGTLFHIELNGKAYETSGTNIELPLVAGRNQLELWTDKDCQGKISRIIELDPEQMVFPNPVESELYIRAGNNKPAIIEIRDMKSRLIYLGRHESLEGMYKVDVGTLAPGVYLLQTIIENRIENFRIIKQ